MKTIKLLLAVALLQISLKSCKQPSEETSASNWSLVLVDSLQVGHLGEMMLLDISPNQELFLTADYQKNTYFIINRNGEKISEINKSGDQPEAFGFAYSEMIFWDDETIFVIGSKGLKWYGLTGNETNFVPFNSEYQLKGIMRNTGGGPIILQDRGNTKILYRGGAVNGKRTEPGYLEKIRGGTLIDPETFDLEHIFPLEKDSRFFDGKFYDDGDLYSRLAVGKDFVYVTYDSNPVLYAYEKTHPYKLSFKRELRLININQSEGMPAEYVDYEVYLDASKGGLRNLQVDDRYVYLMYFEGIPKERLAEIEQLYEIDELKADAAYETEVSKREKRMKVFTLKGEELSDIKLPNFLDSYWGFIARDGFLYFNKAANNEIEEDFYTLYKLWLEQ
ncbi:hypothetical protein [Cecembia lonarensis]|uniref:DUF4221 domain-containing protein n=1 Tax=Cecembia lonarensis (strain CCUG 58316 / KCTC 22772 / LW9) TaxID=1225176 RepID=K1M414_CECL9|nr:hypothetical protein [Cecembia lonarensis]EKB50989.1 hypothetical protein B879_00276 [Cecembia lonarensis LW9]